MDSQEQDVKHWFVLRDFKKWNAKTPAYQAFAKMGIKTFTPMHWVINERNGKRKREYVPVIQDLLFVYDTKLTLDPIIEKDKSLQYQYARGGGQANPMIVSDQEMERFINAVNNDPSPKYFTLDEIKPEMIGMEILVNDGPLRGYQGRLLRIQGSKKKRLMVKIESLMVAAVEVIPEYISLV
ncbi:MAG: UpxY family transcription antiterminator [Muribaculum sp.]|nr:UpxY family transcription antiterminator [Muribaculum sp.]